ncbi:putative pentatricopeptide repeat-containing protein At5g43820 isoform X2 [Macadamia integrifolia]|nr:putative pentatricopeptide repeat-containing protein At5g43820 isoform X2 [Macadamia integrifolia]
MAFKRRGFVGLLAHFNRNRYPQLPSNSYISSFVSFSTLDLTKISSIREQPSYDQINHVSSNMDELSVLNVLSNLLPIHPKTSTYRPFAESSSEKQIQCREVGGYLRPAEKLRGVFLQKLSGKSAIESSLTATSVDLTLDIVAEVVNRGNLGREAMMNFFNWAVKQPSVPNDLQTYHIILRALGRRKFFKCMEEILNDMNKHGIHPSSETLSIAMDSYVRARRVSKAVQMFQRLEKFGSESDTESLNVLLCSLCQRSHVGTAYALFLALRRKMPFNRTTYSIIISGWSKIGRVSEIERTLKAMMEDELDPDCLTFSYLLEGLGRASRIEDAVEVFDQMLQKGCPPDTVAYNAMISNFLSVRDLDSSVKYYEKMLEMNCAPDLDTFTKLISVLLKSRRVADALEMFDEMLWRGIIPKTGVVTSFIEPLCNFGPPHAAMVIYKKARKVGCIISLKAYKLLLMRLSRFGKCGMVLKVWDEMQESGYSSDSDVYEFVVNGLCNIGQLENAALVMEESLCKGFCPSKFIYSKLNNKLIDASRVERAYKLFLKIKKARRAENSRRFWRANGWHF